MKTLVEKAIAETSRLSRDTHKSVAIPGVNAIFLADASSQALHRGLAEAFPGTGGSGPVASVKVHLLFNYTEQKVCDLEVTSGKTSDHELSERYRALMKPGNLLLHDLGYFDTEHFTELDAQGVFYLSRIPAAVTHFFHPDESEFNIWDMLGKSRHLSHDFDLYVGADRNLIGRVVAIRLPRSEWQKRINAVSKEKGRPLTAAEKLRCKWNLYVTNLDLEQASSETVRLIYTTRWQVELIFKSWKSTVGLNQIKHATSKEAMLTFIWARLLSGVVNLYLRSLLEPGNDGEIGILRWQRRLAAHVGKIRELFFGERWCALAQLYLRIAGKGARSEKRRRKTTRENLSDSIALDIEREVASIP